LATFSTALVNPKPIVGTWTTTDTLASLPAVKFTSLDINGLGANADMSVTGTAGLT
jgi:hypothetical protein